MSETNKAIEVLRGVLGSRVVSYHAIFAKALGSVPAAVFLSQGYFWQENASFKDLKNVDGKPFFDKTIDEWYEATGLSEEQQRGARNLLKSLNILFEAKIGVPAKLHYHIDFETLVAVIYGYKETGNTARVDCRHKSPDNARSSSGKFRQLEAVKNGGIYIESLESLKESLESIKEKEEEKAENQKNETPDIETVIALIKAENENPPQIAPLPPALSLTDPLRTKDPVRWAANLTMDWCKANSETVKAIYNECFVSAPTTISQLQTHITDFFVHFQSLTEFEHAATNNPVNFYQRKCRAFIKGGKRLAEKRAAELAKPRPSKPYSKPEPQRTDLTGERRFV